MWLKKECNTFFGDHKTKKEWKYKINIYQYKLTPEAPGLGFSWEMVMKAGEGRGGPMEGPSQWHK
jgi:hypothetical protein